MSALRALWRNLFDKRRVETDLDDELRAAVEILAAEKAEQGMELREARRQAHLQLGGIEQVKESMREVRMGAVLEMIGRDLRQALRGFRRSPGYFGVAAATLALGIGANTAMFTIVDAVLIKGLPYAHANRLVMIAQRMSREDRINFSAREFLELERSKRTLQSVGGGVGNGFTVEWRGEPRACFGQMVTTGLFETLGIGARLGRTFTAEEGGAGRDHEVVLSDRLWRELFGADPQVLGQSVNLNHDSYRIIGVMPPEFEYPDVRYELWVPAALTGGIFQKMPDAHFLRVVGRLRDGASVAALRQDLDALSQQFASRDRAGRQVYTQELTSSVVGDFRTPLALLMGAVALLLLIACANVANLALSRTAARAREFAVRTAIGATRGRLISQALIESLAVALVAGCAGLVLASTAISSIAQANPGRVPLLESARLDWSVVAFTLAISAAASCLFGLVPALTSGGGNLAEHMRQAGRGMVSGSGRSLRRALVFAQIALATVLMIGAGVTIRSLLMLESVPSGLNPNGVLTAGVAMNEQQYPSSQQILSFYRRLVETTRAIPGVADVAIATHLPFTGQGWGNGFEIEGAPAEAGEQRVAQIRPVSPGYFSTLRIPIQQGRAFAESDGQSALPVVIVNATLARRFFPDGRVLGKRLDLDGAKRTIVGVAADVKPGRLDAAVEPEIYFPYEQFGAGTLGVLGRGFTIVARAQTGDALSLAPELRGIVRKLDPGMAVRDVRTFPDLISGTLAQPRFRAMLFGVFSALALLLASVGIYGVVSYSVTQRTREFGVRLALGASAPNIVMMVVAEGAAVALAGVSVGVAGALLLSHPLRALLFSVQPGDPVTIAAVAVVLGAVAIGASFVPALAVTRLDPSETLRGE